MLVVAFDGLLFDTLPARARAITDAFAAEGATVSVDEVLALLPSRCIAEAVAETARAHEHRMSAASASRLDATAIELVTLRAQRAEADIASHGATLNVELRDKLRRSALVTRIVLRSDSSRQVAERLLALAELDDVISFTCCADDLPKAHAGSIRMTSAERSYAHIIRRLAANTSLLGECTSVGVALEHSEVARRVARECGFDAPEHPHGIRIPGA